MHSIASARHSATPFTKFLAFIRNSRASAVAWLLLAPLAAGAATVGLTIAGTPATSVVAGAHYAFQPTVSNPANRKLTFSVRNKPSWAAFSATTGLLSGTPASAQVGTYASISIGVTDGRRARYLNPFSIKVTAPATTPPTTGGGTTTPGKLYMSSAAYSVTQTSGSVRVTVGRSGGSSGAVSVSYATADGTAKTGTDYTHESGALSWAANDASTKTFSVPVTSTPGFTGSKTFTVSLSAATGGATLGSPAAATVTVQGTGGATGGGGTTSGGGTTGGSTSVPPVPSALTPPQPGVSFPGGTTVQPGVAAALGAPTTTLYNGLATVLDPQFHFPTHGVLAAAAGAMPAALASPGLPYIPGLRVLARRDAVILYFNNVAGAADYRAYVVNSNVTFIDTLNGKQPRGAVIACAGFRQHTFESAVANGSHERELLQAVELPGLVAAGNYTIVVEATSSPCPFVGLPAHTDATITESANFHAADPGSYPSTGTHYAKFASFNTVLSQYGNEIINGQGASSSWANRMTLTMGLPVAANDTNSAMIPNDPVVTARSAILVQLPFFDETKNAPVFDVGTNAIEDNFTNDLVVDPGTITVNPDYAGSSTAANAPLVDIPGAWSFWGRYLQLADGQSGVINNVYNPKGMLGLQIFQRHGRLYTTFGDGGQDVGGAIGFASLKTAPQQLDPTKYVHSMFRINSEASVRRYWTWTLCGGATPGELQDPTTHKYKIHPIFVETSFDAAIPGGYYGDNPSAPQPQLGLASIAQAQNPAAKECLSIAEDGTPEYPRSDGSVRSSALIRAQIHPAGYAKGMIVLGNADSDPTSPNPGFRYKLDANRKYLAPMVEPHDQVSPLTHYDFFVRPDRLVVFIDGRQGFCVDMSDRPLTMKYGMITYGDLLYHSALEWENIAAPNTNGDPKSASQLYQVTLNAPIATSRAWDVVAESQQIDIPSQFATFDPSTCFKPKSSAIQ